MQRKSGFPVANCNIKMPDATSTETAYEEEWEPVQRRQQLINFGHSQWGFNNWSWSVSKQELDFVDLVGGKYTVGVAAFVSVSLKSFDIHRENVGYATAIAPYKGSAIHRARKCAVTNALRETLLSFGGSVATELMEQLEASRAEVADAPHENNQNAANRQEPKVSPGQAKKDAAQPPPPAGLPPPANRVPRPAPPPQPAQPPLRPNSNVSFVVPVMGGVVPPLYAQPQPRLAPPHLPPPHLIPNAYYEYATGPWHFAYESFDRHHGNVNLNFNMPPKNLVVNSRGGAECKKEAESAAYGPQGQTCWIKPTIFYDGFWTEQKVKKWVAEQVEKQFPEERARNPASPAANHDARAPRA